MLLDRSSLSIPLREKILTSTIIPSTPGGTCSDVSLTSPAFSPKIARSNFSSGVNCVSPLGVTLPTRISPGLTSAPMRMMPLSSRFLSASSPTFGTSRVISSLPNFVSRASTSNSSTWIEVKASSRTSFSLSRIASSKLNPPQGMKATSTFFPSASSPRSMAGPSASTCPFLTGCPIRTTGVCVMQVFWFERWNLIRPYTSKLMSLRRFPSSFFPDSARTTILLASTLSTTPARFACTT